MRGKLLFSISLILLITSFDVFGAVNYERRDAVVKAVEKTSPAVVNISTEIIVRRRANPFFGFR